MQLQRLKKRGVIAGRIKRRQGLGDDVYDAIYAMLMSLELAPGARVSVDALARELGVSQTPVREALSRLEVQGLVIKTHLVGYSAAPQIDDVRLQQLYDLRGLLEPHIAAEAARNMSDAQIERLFELDREMRQLCSAGPRSYAQFAELDGQFHDLIAAGSGNDVIHEALTSLHIHIHLFRSSFHASATAEAVDEHGRIVEAIARRDPLAAREAMYRHIEQSKRRFIG